MRIYTLDGDMESDRDTDESEATVVVTSMHLGLKGIGFNGTEVRKMSLTEAIAYCKGFWHGVNLAPEGDDLGTLICLDSNDDSLEDFKEVSDPEVIRLADHEIGSASKREGSGTTQ